jgi:hypothetical protein
MQGIVPGSHIATDVVHATPRATVAHDAARVAPPPDQTGGPPSSAAAFASSPRPTQVIPPGTPPASPAARGSGPGPLVGSAKSRAGGGTPAPAQALAPSRERPPNESRSPVTARRIPVRGTDGSNPTPLPGAGASPPEAVLPPLLRQSASLSGKRVELGEFSALVRSSLTPPPHEWGQATSSLGEVSPLPLQLFWDPARPRFEPQDDFVEIPEFGGVLPDDKRQRGQHPPPSNPGHQPSLTSPKGPPGHRSRGHSRPSGSERALEGLRFET